ncbi:pantetheine-phosphate adenylyltransferase [Amaricoccus sp.]|uniref:pantetheine-phosphate adenylyltransferase n=1 Tax=Amaricoccus sp. TaxID=1872485 RepID=UPI001B453D62|nr:pantetheine-phosphate adenylyltransferase [Amaricoccus sp.]MBP7241651.1 pantetheine-phosphate adenylyltransferase [Amaricoccus sp.]
MRIGLYPGTFDPVTLGHIDIIRRACSLVDRLVIGIAINRDKGPLFSLDERVAMVEELAGPVGRASGVEIVAHPFENLLIHCAEDVDAHVIIRGLRAVSDFEYEFQMVGMNRAMNDTVETVFLMADAHHQAIASRLVKEIARLGGDVRPFVPPAIAAALAGKFGTPLRTQTPIAV